MLVEDTVDLATLELGNYIQQSEEGLACIAKKEDQEECEMVMGFMGRQIMPGKIDLQEKLQHRQYFRHTKDVNCPESW